MVLGGPVGRRYQVTIYAIYADILRAGREGDGTNSDARDNIWTVCLTFAAHYSAARGGEVRLGHSSGKVRA
jgi:hypothetical protein